jgi:membrane protease YdiL (CAAX protease family)
MPATIDRLPPPDQRPAAGRRWFPLGLVAAGMLYLVLLLIGGEARALAEAGLEPLPFVALALLAYAAGVSTRLRALTLLWLLGVTVAAALLSRSLARDAGGSERTVTVLLLAGLGAGWLCLAPPVRRAVARVTPLDPHSFVHAVALVAVVSCTLLFFVPVLVQGAPPLLVAGDDAATGGSLRDDLYGLLWMLPATVLAVGWPLARSFPAALRRLGLVRPTRRQLLFGVLGGALMVAGFVIIDNAIAWLWDTLGWATTNDAGVDELLGYAYNPLGALVVGVTAGLGEELAVRGVLQPRLGLLLSNLFFTSLHAFQYNLDGLVSVFLAGLFLGLVRRRSNTSTSAIVHGVYDAILLLLSMLATRHVL